MTRTRAGRFAETGPPRSLRGGVGAVVVAVAVQSMGNLVFHAVAGRGLDPADYGALGALLTVMVLLAVPLSGLQNATSAAVAIAPAVPPGSVLRLVGRPALVAVAPAALVLLAAGAVAEWLHVPAAAAALLAPSLVVAVALAAARGVLLGAGRPHPVAGGYVVSVAIRIASVLVIAPTVGSALVGSLLGELAALAVALRAIRATRRPGPRVVVGRARLARNVSALLVMFLFSTGDILLARHHLAPGESGAYVAAATVAKAALALPAAVMSVWYPRFVRAWSTADPWPEVRRGAAVVLALAAAGSAALVLAPGLALGVLYGSTFDGQEPLVRVLAATAMASAVVTVAVHSALARGSRAALLVPVTGALVQLVLIEHWHGSALEVAGGSAASAAATAVLAVLVERRRLARWCGTSALSDSCADPAPPLRSA